ncbi:hypothetical protein SAMN05216496_3028 [Pseudomonas sp. Z003-0.4C(8344-21)]|jgi:hypothetical protein|nr:hypothetical protein SAMN05216496_3028 [Pseudomonas sp. Z003-0.4C(8344-21)]
MARIQPFTHETLNTLRSMPTETGAAAVYRY